VGYSDAFSQKLELQISQSSRVSHLLDVDERGFTPERTYFICVRCLLLGTDYPFFGIFDNHNWG
jgi:hypothetical protein